MPRKINLYEQKAITALLREDAVVLIYVAWGDATNSSVRLRDHLNTNNIEGIAVGIRGNRVFLWYPEIMNSKRLTRQITEQAHAKCEINTDMVNSDLARENLRRVLNSSSTPAAGGAPIQREGGAPQRAVMEMALRDEKITKEDFEKWIKANDLPS